MTIQPARLVTNNTRVKAQLTGLLLPLLTPPASSAACYQKFSAVEPIMIYPSPRRRSSFLFSDILHFFDCYM